MKRLDEMEFAEIANIYKKIISEIINEEEFEKEKREYEKKYINFFEHINAGMKIKGGTLGRGEIKYARNIIYGWFLESLISKAISKNPKVKRIKFFGDDKSHGFFVNQDSKIEIKGPKTTEPDFLIEFHNGDNMFMELKSAAKEIFTIKKGNIEQLSKAAGFNKIPTSIIMIDLVNKTFEIKNLEYFFNARPFVNQRFEGQLCFDFPRPENPINKLCDIDISSYINNNIFNLDIVKKYILLSIAENNNLRNYIRILKNKMKLEKLIEEFDFSKEDFEIKIRDIRNKYPEVNKSWNDLENEINKEINKK